MPFVNYLHISEINWKQRRVRSCVLRNIVHSLKICSKVAGSGCDCWICDTVRNSTVPPTSVSKMKMSHPTSPSSQNYLGWIWTNFTLFHFQVDTVRMCNLERPGDEICYVAGFTSTHQALFLSVFMYLWMSVTRAFTRKCLLYHDCGSHW
jgi:hypothetical protein